MREQASTPQGRASATASATFEASRPPAKIIRFAALAAMQLRDIEPGLAGDLFNARRRFIHENADPTYAARRCDIRGQFGRNITGAAQPEIEADGGRAALYGGSRVVGVRETANLEDHGPTSFRSAEAGSRDLMRCSPTRNAVYPAARSLAMSPASRIPLSLTLTTPSGMCSASHREVSSLTSKVARSRLLTPMISLPASRAASNSCRL